MASHHFLQKRLTEALPLSQSMDHNKLSGKHFLIDSGAEVSILPPMVACQMRGCSTKPLTAVNSSIVKSYGSRGVNIQLHGHAFKWQLTIADTNCHLLGADTLQAHSLLPNWATPGLFSATLSVLHGRAQLTCLLGTTVRDDFQQLLADRPQLTNLVFNLAPWHMRWSQRTYHTSI